MGKRRLGPKQLRVHKRTKGKRHQVTSYPGSKVGAKHARARARGKATGYDLRGLSDWFVKQRDGTYKPRFDFGRLPSVPQGSGFFHGKPGLDPTMPGFRGFDALVKQYGPVRPKSPKSGISAKARRRERSRAPSPDQYRAWPGKPKKPEFKAKKRISVKEAQKITKARVKRRGLVGVPPPGMPALEAARSRERSLAPSSERQQIPARRADRAPTQAPMQAPVPTAIKEEGFGPARRRSRSRSAPYGTPAEMQPREAQPYAGAGLRVGRPGQQKVRALPPSESARTAMREAHQQAGLGQV